MRKKIFVFIGVIGSGKDYMANQYIQKYGAVKTDFADPLREDIWKLLDWTPYTDEEYDLFKRSEFHNDLGIKFTGRDLLLKYGTEIRRAEDPNHWCKQTIREIERLFLYGFPAVVITDCRFTNEVSYLKKAANMLECDIEFIFCNYPSDRYDNKVDHESEKLAQNMVDLGFTHKSESFDSYIKSQNFGHIPNLTNNKTLKYIN